ncbi:MAG: methionine aminopeptidase [Pirellulaceae bacterium]|nr:MAG: methionine aminopeptidase [Pirellulaceae bacterium]
MHGVELKSARELERMRRAGLIVWVAHRVVCHAIRPGCTTAQLDQLVERVLEAFGAEPLFLGVPGPAGPFPAVSCISVNEELVHGIPGPRILQEGDIVSVDIGCRFDGWCGDSAWTYPVGQIDARCQKLLEVTRRTLELALEELPRQQFWRPIARRMAQYVESQGFSVVREFSGHGIGRRMHEPPQVPNYVDRSLRLHDIRIVPGLVVAIEPMVNAGSRAVRMLPDGWTIVTADGQPCAHFEHTVARTDTGIWILTGAPQTPDEDAFVRPVLEKFVTESAD